MYRLLNADESMKSLRPLLALLLAGVLIAGLSPVEAQTGRIGGARSFGVQRPVAPSPQKIPPASQAAPQSAQAPQGAAAPSPGARAWLGPITGLAAGLGLGWLNSQGAGLTAAVMAGLLAGVLAIVLLRRLMRPRAVSQPLRYAEPGELTAAAPHPAQSPVPGAQAGPRIAVPAPPIPADFDSAAFIRQAKLNFIRLQEAHDRGDLNALREVTTERMFDAILADLRPHRPAQRTDLVSLDASLLEVATEGEKHSASVRFHGTIRENENEAARFEEVWNLQKPVSGSSGWVLAGIQQVS